jgi:hypothetical protein
VDISSSVGAIFKEGGITAVAVLALYMLNSVWMLVLAREKTYAAEIARVNEQLLKTINDHTEATTRLTMTIENFLHGTDRSDHAKS